MKQQSTFSVALAFAFAAAVTSACTVKEERVEVQKDPNCAAEDASAPPAKGGSTSSGTSDLGPQCEAYLVCCEELAEANPNVAGSCDTLKDQIATAQENGASATSYESACKSGLTSARSAGYCE